MDGAEVFRAVRRRAGLSQRQLAAVSGVALSTVSAVESGRRAPSLPALRAVLEVAGLELAVDRVPPELDEQQRAHLRLSLTRRLDLALGGDGRPQDRLPTYRSPTYRSPTYRSPTHRSSAARTSTWQQLMALATTAEVHLHGDLALGLWLPLEAAPAPEVCAAVHRARPRPDTPDLVVVEPCGERAPAPVVVPLPSGRVRADAPADLALDPGSAAHRLALRAVARALHVEAARDEAGRRPRAHRDPDHGAEREHVFHTKRFGRLPMPDDADVRSWRLEDDASLDAWLRRHDYPV